MCSLMVLRMTMVVVEGHVYLSSDDPWVYNWSLCRVYFPGFQRRRKRRAFEFQDFSTVVRVFEFQNFKQLTIAEKL